MIGTIILKLRSYSSSLWSSLPDAASTWIMLSELSSLIVFVDTLLLVQWSDVLGGNLGN